MVNPAQIVESRQILDPHHARVDAGTLQPHDQEAARRILDRYVATAKTRAELPIQRILSEVPTDFIVRGKALDFAVGADGVARMQLSGEDPMRIHDNALTQLAEKMEIHGSYARHLQTHPEKEWAQPLLAHTLKEHAKHLPQSERMLVRACKGQARAVLSDRFRRIDCRPALDALLGEAQKVGALVTDAVVLDVRASVRILLPKVLEIAPGEFVVLGLAWSNSDYGKGAQSLAPFCMRVWCLNGATLEQALRQVHLGGRLTDYEVQYSASTIAADSRALTLAMRDAARALLSPIHIERTADIMRTAANTPIEAKRSAEDLRKRLGKGVAERIASAFNTADVEALPPGNTQWRLSNAISWVARQDDVDAETRLDLEREAGLALGKK
jgi:hypothetical protein